MSRFGSPFLSAPEGGYANPGWSTEYVELMPQEGHIWMGYYVNGNFKTLPVKTWDSSTGDVGEDWGTFS
ncbi:SH3 domain-containing protein [Salinicoccus bachuensis]|uniref:SH3 domain-containing protein n=1 Tax=Salinicoccus bachuensis TaxID=3136731 RepID=A0ABZ3ID93_9STAP